MKRLIDTNHLTVYLWPSHHHWFITANHICVGPVEIMLRYWFVKRATWRVIGRLLWAVSPRLRGEYHTNRQRALDDGYKPVDFPEWVSWRIFPDSGNPV